jgi:hypothetical protein
MILKRAHSRKTDIYNKVFGDELKTCLPISRAWTVSIITVTYFCEKLITKEQILCPRQICRI